MLHICFLDEMEKHPISFLLKLITDRVESVWIQPEHWVPVTYSQCRVITYLVSRQGEAVSQRELGCYLGVSHTTVKGLIRRLEEKGLVRTAVDGADKRVKHVYLTSQFFQRSEELHSIAQQLESRLLKGISSAEQAVLKSLLNRIYQNACESLND